MPMLEMRAKEHSGRVKDNFTVASPRSREGWVRVIPILRLSVIEFIPEAT